jgi:sigma-B regulation protein RsbU (phosphoserine phosphatase)
MFIPCDHCLRKHATQTFEITEEGRRQLVQLCKDCTEKHKRDSLIPESLRDPEAMNQAMEAHEESIAQRLQADLVQRAIPQIAGYDLDACHRPAPKVGGDYYEYFSIDADHIGMVVAEVSGKGIAGLIVMTETRALAKSEAVRTLSPAETLIRVNRMLHGNLKRGMFVTMYYAILEISTGILTCASAGHNPLVLWRKSSKTCHLVNPNGLALGIDEGPVFDKTLKEERIQLCPGDRFTLFTDGVTDSMNEQNEQYGQNRFYLRLRDLSEASSSEFLVLMMKEVERFCGSAHQRDNLTILTGRYRR